MILVVVSALMFLASYELVVFGDMAADIAALCISSFWIPLYMYYQKIDITLSCRWRDGFFWGIIVFTVHFRWIYLLLITYCKVSSFEAFLSNAYIILGFVFFTSLWFLIVGFFSSWMRVLRYKTIFFVTFIILLGGYFKFLQCQGLWFLGIYDGYPLLDPRLIFARSRWGRVLWMLGSLINLSGATWFSLETNQWYVQEQGSGTFFSVPLVATYNWLYITINEMSYLDSQEISQQLAKQLKHTLRSSNNKPTIIVTPEAIYPYALNEHKDTLALLGDLVQKNHLIVGAYREDEGRYFQSIYHLHDSRIKNFYDKKHRVPFTEYIPPLWTHFLWVKNLFLCGKHEISPGLESGGVLLLDENICIIPRICSEIFYCTESIEQLKKQSLFLWFIKDSWFTKSIAALIECKAYVQACTFKKSVIAIFSNHVLTISIHD